MGPVLVEELKWWIVIGVIGGLAVCLLLFGGCTTILTPNPQPVGVYSSPTGASVTVNSAPRGQTPTNIDLDKKLTYMLEVQKSGYAPYAQMVTKTVDPLFFLNILFLLGFLVDLATGTWQKFPDQVMAPMVPLAANRRW